MDRRSWLWRRKSQNNNLTNTQEGSQVASNCNTPKTVLSLNFSSTAGDEDGYHGRVKDLRENLNDALSIIVNNEECLQEHARGAYEAVAGREFDRAEVETLKKQLEDTLQKNSSLQNQNANLKVALKECFKQLQKSKEAQEEKTKILLSKKALEFDLYRPEIYLKLENLQKENTDLKANLIALSDDKVTLEQMAEVANVEKANKFDTKHYKLDPVLCKIGFDNRSGMQNIDFSSVEMKLMEDFLEMERLVSFEDNEKKKIIEKLERDKAQNENLDKKQKLFQKNFNKEKRLSEKNREMEKDLKFALEAANLKIVKLQNELSNLEIRINKEKAVSVEVEAKYREMKASIAKMNGETKDIQVCTHELVSMSVNAY